MGEATKGDGEVGACDEEVDVDGLEWKPITAILQTLEELESIKEVILIW